MKYTLLDYATAIERGWTEEYASLDELKETYDWEERAGLFRIDGDGTLTHICSEGAYDCPEDNFFFRHYSSVITELNRLAAESHDPAQDHA
jgi:hypothetical protein